MPENLSSDDHRPGQGLTLARCASERIYGHLSCATNRFPCLVLPLELQPVRGAVMGSLWYLVTNRSHANMLPEPGVRRL